MLLQTLKNHFPIEEIINCYAYGSNIAKQSNTTPSKMIDFIFIVKDIQDFHIANRKKNRSHYAAIEKIFNLSSYINTLGTKVYYHQNIPIENTLVKYGVISQNDFENSLQNWSNLFIAGRFHKPVQSIIQGINYDSLLENNRKQAFALIALGSKLNPFKDTFYQAITDISYKGDIRRLCNIESNNKTKNMVKGSFDQYDAIYSKFALSSTKNKLSLKDDLKFYMNFLPKEFQSNFPEHFLTLSVIERKKVIDRILHLNNLKSSCMAALSGLYSSPSFDYILDKYKRKYNH